MVTKYSIGSECVLASLSPDSESIRLVLVDVKTNITTSSGHRQTATPYTSVEFDKERFLNLALSPDEFARIGENVVARLVAYWKARE